MDSHVILDFLVSQTFRPVSTFRTMTGEICTDKHKHMRACVCIHAVQSKLFLGSPRAVFEFVASLFSDSATFSSALRASIASVCR